MEGVSTSVKVTGSVTTEQLLGKPLTDFFNRCMLAGHKDVAQPGRVPIDTGYLRGSLAPGAGGTMVDPSPLPKWASVGTVVDAYPGALEFKDNMHYRDGPSQGSPTKGWLADTIPNVQGDVADFLVTLAKDMQGAFGGS